MFLRNQFKGVGMFRLPLIKKQNINLDSVKLIGYDKISQNSDFSKIVHFYLDDYKFEDIYSKPDKKLVLLKKFKAVLTPDFSMYLEMPVPLQLYAAFKSRWVGAYLQSQGVKVIPTVRWADLTSFNYCFDGIEKGSIVAVSTVGTKKEKAHFMLGYNEMYSRIKPSTVICYGKPYPEMKGNIIVVDYSETNHSKSNDDTCYIKKAHGYITSNDTKGGGSAGGGESGNPKPRIEAENIDELLNNPEQLSNYSPEQIYKWLNENGYDVQPLSRGSLKGKPFSDGGGFKVNYGGDGLFQYHPAGGHHGGAYYKISSGTGGTVRYDLFGNIL